MSCRKISTHDAGRGWAQYRQHSRREHLPVPGRRDEAQQSVTSLSATSSYGATTRGGITRGATTQRATTHSAELRSATPWNAERGNVDQKSTEQGRAEQGSAAVEFIFLGVLLVIPLVYFLLTLAQVQGGAFALSNAVSNAATVYVNADGPEQGAQRANRAIDYALKDFGIAPSRAQRSIECSPGCAIPGSMVRVTVRLSIDLPIFSRLFGNQMKVVDLADTASAKIPRFH